MLTRGEKRGLKTKIERLFVGGGEAPNLIIFPYGEIGQEVKELLEDVYGIEPKYILDNHLCKFNAKIKPLEYLKNVNCRECVLILATTRMKIYDELKTAVLWYIDADRIIEIEGMRPISNTKCGKYSYGVLCDHWLVESVGAFSGFANGCQVVQNHPLNYLSTHPFVYYGSEHDLVHHRKYNECQAAAWYFPGVEPKGRAEKLHRITIGNDVWLGANVIITNGANIGNGVIAGAGAVITKDVPDYAIVAGVPARIIRYRYTPEQIEALNRIQWWNWSDEEIRERYEDFYIPIEEFIAKYDKS